MKTREFMKMAMLCLSAFAGGALSERIFASNVAVAAMESAGGQLREFFDQNRKKRLDVGVYAGTPMQNFYGEDGKVRIQFGTYNAAGEKGLPLAGFSDNKGNLRLLLRLAGSNESPVIISKTASTPTASSWGWR